MISKKKIKTKIKPKKTLFKSRRIKIKVVGIGGGGSSIVSEIAKNISNASFVVFDSDHRVFKKAGKGVKVVQLGEELTNGLGTGMDVNLGRKIVEKEKEKIIKILKDQDLVILVGSLGGGFASGALPLFAEVTKNLKNISLGIFTLPFKFEGEKKLKIAQESLEQIEESLSGQFIVSNEKIFEIIDKKTPLKKALSSLNKSLILMLEDLIEVISKPGLINIDFADLKTILSGRGRTIHFGSAVAQGPNRAEEVIKKVFENPLSVGDIGKCKKILFNIRGGKDLTLKEVEKISMGICGLNKTAKIIFGISENLKNNNKIKLTLIQVGEGKKEKKPVVKKTKALTSASTKALVKKKVAVKKKKQKDSFSSKINVETKKIDRKSGLEIVKEKKKEEEEEWTEDSDWQIPTFIRRNKEK
jgi:cell division protein FtsZ